MIIVSRAGNEECYDGAADRIGTALRLIMRERYPSATVIGLIAPTGAALLEAWQACLDEGKKPVILHYPTPKLSRVYWEDEMLFAVKTIGIELLFCATDNCRPSCDVPCICFDDLATPKITLETSGLAGNNEIIQLSSGTTGHRKGITFTLSAIRQHISEYNQILGLTEQDCVVSWLPLYHDMGFITGFLMPRFIGCKLVLIDPIEWVGRPEQLWELIDEHNATICYMPNFAFELMARRGRAAPSIRRWISCSEPTRRHTMERFIEATGTSPTSISNSWGMAENIFAVSHSVGIKPTVIDGIEVISCGRPIPGTEVKVVDGELFVRSAYSLKRYIDSDDIVDVEGFYPSGDLGAIIDGDIYLIGRKRDIIITAGRKTVLSDIDFLVGEAVPQSAGRIATFAYADEGLATEIPISVIEDPAFWDKNREADNLRAIVARTGNEIGRAAFVPPRFITKTSSGKINRRKTSDHWRALSGHAAKLAAERGDSDGQMRGEIARDFPWVNWDVPISEQLDSLGLVNFSLTCSKYGRVGGIGENLTIRSLLEAGNHSTDEEEVLRIVSIGDNNPFRALGVSAVQDLTKIFGKPVQYTNVCAPPLPILMSDLVFADFFMCRDDREGVYLPLLSALETIKSASILLVDDIAEIFWPRSANRMVYPRISHDFQAAPAARFLGVRWAKYTENHHQIGCRLVSGEEIDLDAVNRNLDDLASYLQIPIVRVAYSKDFSQITEMWDVHGYGDAEGIAARSLLESIDRDNFHDQLLHAVRNAARNAPLRASALDSFIQIDDQPHWCSWLISKEYIDFILNNFKKILILGKMGSVPYLYNQACDRGIELSYRSDLFVPDGFECVVQLGSWGKPETDLPIFQAMGAGWLGEPVINLPTHLADKCPPNRIEETLMSELEDAQREIAQLREQLRQSQDACLQAWTFCTRHVVMNSTDDAYFNTDFNGVRALIPRDTLRTMIHCVHMSTSAGVRVLVEWAHMEWMVSQMAPGGTFIDVGAATGAMTIPMVTKFGNNVRIIAFEPARKARSLLIATLQRNGLTGVEIVPHAVSSEVGTVNFAEYAYDETGAVPFLPEGSAIYSGQIDDTQATQFDVPATTLDAFFGDEVLGRPVVIKIDVEGFEVHVLEGSLKLISETRPSFAIDVHKDPFGEGTTEGKVRALLEPRGYEIANMGHVLTATHSLTNG